jgi:hypothetical protein
MIIGCKRKSDVKVHTTNSNYIIVYGIPGSIGSSCIYLDDKITSDGKKPSCWDIIISMKNNDGIIRRVIKSRNMGKLFG